MRNKRAISLIVLVITIIVMAILAATVIITLSNTNIISEANNAVQKTEAQQIEEAKILMQADGMLGKNPEPITIGDTTLTWDEESKTVIEKTNDTTDIGNVTIPENFYYVGGTKDTGLVISDSAEDENKGVDYTCKGNQFVWVPVEYTATGVTDTDGLDTGFTAVFKRGKAEETSLGSGIYKMTGELSSDWAEPYTSGYSDGKGTEEKAEYSKMMLSVQKNKGFYIARFEAGDGDATSKRTKATEAHTVVSKKNAYVYNYVPWGDSMTKIGTTGAVYLSQNMYKGSNSVVSTLCYGVQWDSIMNFVSDEDHDIEDPSSWGNYREAIGDAATNSGVLNTTGKNEAWKAKNIYDLAGNVSEWTMESYYGRVSRDGYYALMSGGVGYRDEEAGYGPLADTYVGIGFRVALYIK